MPLPPSMFDAPPPSVGIAQPVFLHVEKKDGTVGRGRRLYPGAAAASVPTGDAPASAPGPADSASKVCCRDVLLPAVCV
jgi:hypothetical protein